MIMYMRWERKIERGLHETASLRQRTAHMAYYHRLHARLRPKCSVLLHTSDFMRGCLVGAWPRWIVGNVGTCAALGMVVGTVAQLPPPSAMSSVREATEFLKVHCS